VINLTDYYLLCSARVVGTTHHDWKDQLSELFKPRQDPVVMHLSAEPTNPHDNKAIRVLTEGDGDWLLGYLPRDSPSQLIVGRVLGGGYKLIAIFAKNSTQDNPIIDIYQERKK